jgi:uracil-DNA glycosylase family 4
VSDIQFNLFDPEMNELLSADSYSKFREMLVRSDCQRCDLHKSRTRIVVDRGNPSAPILAVGEGPGENEDRQGLVFVGRAGHLLDEIMASVGIRTDTEMLLANIVKCRPPENRAPQKAEAETCLPFLKKQISLVKPKLVLLLGAVALSYMLSERKSFSMEEEVGKFFTIPGYPGTEFVTLYHPAFLLRDPRKKKDMWDHVRKVKRHLAKLR